MTDRIDDILAAREARKAKAAKAKRSEQIGQAVVLFLFFGLLGTFVIWLISLMWRSILGG